MRPARTNRLVVLAGLVAVASRTARHASATEVSFEPGPGLKKNPDGSYSRVVDRDYLEAVGATDDPSQDAPSSSTTNLLVTLLLCVSVYVWFNRDALVAAVQAGEFPGGRSFGEPARAGTRGPGRPLGTTPSTARPAPASSSSQTAERKSTPAEVAEARAARLARFTGEGPKRAEAAFQEALERNAPSPGAASSAPAVVVNRGAGGATTAAPPVQQHKGRVATLGSLASDRDDGDDGPDEFFGGDSTNTQY